jgi:hypothetical protein
MSGWMNIKGLGVNNILPLDPKPRVDGGVRTQGSTDRDGNGRQEGKEKDEKRKLTEQEFDDALKALEANPGLKSNNLTIKVETVGDIRMILIEDSSGALVRRLSESQLWLVTRDKDRQTGKILDKAM